MKKTLFKGDRMKKKSAYETVSSASRHKQSKPTKARRVLLKKHHAKPYRKRHFALLVVLIAALAVSIMLLVQYRDQVLSGFAASRAFLSSLFTEQVVNDRTVTSSLGFTLSYDARTLYASGVDQDTGQLYAGSELERKRPYSLVRLTPAFATTETQVAPTSSLTATVVSSVAEGGVLPVAMQQAGIDAEALRSIAYKETQLAGRTFMYHQWETLPNDAFPSGVKAYFDTYMTDLGDGTSLVVTVALGLDRSSEALYDTVLDTMLVQNPGDSAVLGATTNLRQYATVLPKLDAFAAFGSVPNAAAAAPISEQIAAQYSPAVVKIYSAYCADILVDGRLFFEEVCAAGTGSGFFVSQDGYVATNGHVVSSDPKGLALQYAVAALASNGDSRYLEALMVLAGLTDAKLAVAQSEEELVAIIVDAVYDMSDARFSRANNVESILVNVTDQSPDVDAWLQSIQERRNYTDDDNVLAAELVDEDYRLLDGYDGFRASDVAILKVDGSQFPVVRLGSISDVTQGANLSILGYPGEASGNGIVETTATMATLTSGKVSSIKSDSGGEHKLIETDTTIGKGNSGGPVFADNGAVVGIATYTADGSGEGGGVYNYVRDIQDLLDLAKENDITFDTDSRTQAEWDEGLSYFYNSRYSRALENFEIVEDLYPDHNRVAEFIATAKTRIANGEDVKDFPVALVAGIAVVLLLASGAVIFVMVRHHHKHKVYAVGVAQGTVVPQSVPQQVHVTPAQPEVQPSRPVVPPVTNAPPMQPEQGPESQDAVTRPPFNT
ncbi:hypothetical protein CL689_07375 [Candidatus Saccharibacteria bacterium]|nr:hypothetical protein [Candidatus Saccharibacteria bacterium]MBQ69838.1 hypothetical protein [Candidatus Saccharibacteria bacterium]|tara:strand:+ start:182 stop:2521 length:2340 start_codon:yes stop_codon:yes gene_type:complete